MPLHIFFSWQSDVANRVGRNFIEKALERAIAELKAGAEVDEAARNEEIAVDRDTRGVPGSPPIMEAIFAKIDRAAVFLADMTYVATRLDGKKVPNPNVCIEHGYALKALGWRRTIAVMNTAMGDPKDHELPFDLRHARWPMQFQLAEGADEETRRVAREGLVRDLKDALSTIFGDDQASEAMRRTPAGPHPHDVELLRRFHDQIPIRLKLFLRQHNFGNSFIFTKLAPLHQMNEDWEGADFEFNDPQVQAAFAPVRTLAGEFGDLVLERIYAMPGSDKMGWPKTDRDVEIGIQPRTEQAIRDLNAKAAALTEAVDSFERVARERLRAAGGPHVIEAKAGVELGAALRLQRETAEEALAVLAADEHRGGVPMIVSRPRLVVALAPFAAAEGKRLDPRHVSEVQQRFPPNVDTAVTAEGDASQWWSYGPVQRPEPNLNPETSWLMRIVRPGYLEYRATIGVRIDDDPEILVDGRRLEGMIVRTIERMGQIAAALELGGPGLVCIILEGMETVELTRPRGGGRRIRQQGIALPPGLLDDLATPAAAALQEQLDRIWQFAGWRDGSPSFGGAEWAGYSDARNYEALDPAEPRRW